MALLRFLVSFFSRAQAIAFAVPLNLLKPKFQFSLLIVSSFSAKLLHLYTHRSSLPIVLSLLYLPTFLLPDAALIIGSKVLLFQDSKHALRSTIRLLAALFTYITAVASTCQISFYFETGGEIQWAAGLSLASDPGASDLLLSGLPAFALTLATLLGASGLATPWLYSITESFIDTVSFAFKEVYNVARRGRKARLSSEELEAEESLLRGPSEETPAPSARKAITIVVAVLVAVGTCGTLQILRPITPPYDHMSGSLPFTMIGSLLFRPSNDEFCFRHPHGPVRFPFNDTFSDAAWEPAQGYAPGWMPQSEECQAKRRRHHRPHAKIETRHGANDSFHQPYDPACDPLRISNLDGGVLDPIEDALATSRVPIKHVVVLTLESTRKDVFPFQKGSYPYDIIRQLSENPIETDELDEKLAWLSPVSEILTGESSGFSLPRELAGKTSPYSRWSSRFNSSFGGINILDAQTGSDYTIKSLIGSHCGAEPLPADFTEEAKGRIYQPCIPQILDMFNEGHGKQPLNSRRAKKSSNFLSSPWESVLVQSTTDQFDSQDILEDHMGFRHVITKETLLDPSSKFFPPKEPECNYFAFPETEVLPYLEDLFMKAERENRRLFLSHLTSTTHHPFHTPESWGKHEDFIPRSKWGSQDPFNGYLNTIRYQDEWIGTIFNLLERVGVLDQTLVVIVGDHGMAFDSVDGSFQTYQNGHISNFQVPLLFLHPQLPRLQLKAKTTSLSIIPTILDLLIQTKSLNTGNIDKAQQLMHRYQGQSLIRQFIPTKDGGRQLWYFGLINPGGSMMVISSAATPYRLLLPLCSSTQFKFTDISVDPTEKHPIEEWTMDSIVKKVRREAGDEAAAWVAQAEKLGRWWFWEQRYRWNYHKAARSTDRSARESQGGQIKEKGWLHT